MMEKYGYTVDEQGPESEAQKKAQIDRAILATNVKNQKETGETKKDVHVKHS